MIVIIFIIAKIIIQVKIILSRTITEKGSCFSYSFCGFSSFICFSETLNSYFPNAEKVTVGWYTFINSDDSPT